ncbi:hypothetical protein MMPV_006665 [Pyropia vietnamensis]
MPAVAAAAVAAVAAAAAAAAAVVVAAAAAAAVAAAAAEPLPPDGYLGRDAATGVHRLGTHEAAVASRLRGEVAAVGEAAAVVAAAAAGVGVGGGGGGGGSGGGAVAAAPLGRGARSPPAGDSRTAMRARLVGGGAMAPVTAPPPPRSDGRRGRARRKGTGVMKGTHTPGMERMRKEAKG